MKRQKITSNTKKNLLLGVLLLGLFIGYPLYPTPDYPWPRPVGKKLPGQPPIDKPFPSATVIYSDIINVE